LQIEMTGQPGYCPEWIFHIMNFGQMHERLRLELLRRMQRGTLTVSLLARKTGFGQSHMSNFLRKNRRLSIAALDRVLLALHMTVADLLPAQSGAFGLEADDAVPLVSHATALFEPHIRPSWVRRMISVPANVLCVTCPTPTPHRQSWQRFVAVSISAVEAQPMEPVISAEAVVVLDRHYTSLRPYRPHHINVYAVRNGSHLVLRYLDFVASRLVLRPHNLAFSVDLVQLSQQETLADWITGRIVLAINQP
jgi:transcriptional regulator with XRE-family HTH domain